MEDIMKDEAIACVYVDSWGGFWIQHDQPTSVCFGGSREAAILLPGGRQVNCYADLPADRPDVNPGDQLTIPGATVIVL